MKHYLTEEDARNRAHHHLYERLIRLATGQGTHVLVAHHLTFELPVAEGVDSEPNEIPSADTLMFCHEFMDKAFGIRAHGHMQLLAAMPVGGGKRELELERMVDAEEDRRRERVISQEVNPCLSGS